MCRVGSIEFAIENIERTMRKLFFSIDFKPVLLSTNDADDLITPRGDFKTNKMARWQQAIDFVTQTQRGDENWREVTPINWELLRLYKGADFVWEYINVGAFGYNYFIKTPKSQCRNMKKWDKYLADFEPKDIKMLLSHRHWNAVLLKHMDVFIKEADSYHPSHQLIDNICKKVLKKL